MWYLFIPQDWVRHPRAEKSAGAVMAKERLKLKMSRLYYFVCNDCHLVLDTPVGKNSWAYGLWNPDKAAEFLHDHTGHLLSFLDEHTVDDMTFYEAEWIRAT